MSVSVLILGGVKIVPSFETPLRILSRVPNNGIENIPEYDWYLDEISRTVCIVRVIFTESPRSLDDIPVHKYWKTVGDTARGWHVDVVLGYNFHV